MSATNFLVAASAGTGKTFALSSHVLRLLLLGEKPEAILALTFSRLAAAEIFDRVVGRLAAATESDAEAAKLSGELAEGEGGGPLRARFPGGVPRVEFLRVLRAFLAAQHRSRLGTIDSFMARMVQAFPAETGLRGDVRMLDDDAAALRRERVVEDLLQSRRADVFGQLETILGYAEDGRLRKTFRDYFSRQLRDWHARFRAQPDRAAWGDPARIWAADPATAERVAASDAEGAARAELALSAFREAALPLCDDPKGVARGYLETFCAEVPGLGPDALSDSRAAIANFVAAADSADAAPVVKCNRARLALTAPAAAALREVVGELRAGALRRQCRRAQGLYVLLYLLEELWARDVRGEGELVFDDVPLLVSALSARDRRDIEWRLDGRFRHLALDEFQDTSPAQWRALRLLADEAKQADDRTLFLVGDAKQAIYGWRGGDSRLFLAERASGAYTLGSLVRSHRFRPEIAGFVDRVFRGEEILGTFGASEVPAAADAAARWAETWEGHASALDPGGFVRAAPVRAPDPDAGEEEADVFAAAIAARLAVVRPWERGLVAAVLVRDRNQGVPLVRALRETHGLRATWEGDSAVADTPAVRAVLDALVLAQHPDRGSFAWGHVRSSPLGRALLSGEERAREDGGLAPLSRRIARDLARKGLAETVRDLAQAAFLAAGAEGAAFLRARLDALVAAAADYAADPDRSGTMLDFRRYVRARTERAFADPATVKVLTIHKSKGLGFDLVFVPFFRGRRRHALGTLHSHLGLVLEGPGDPPAWYLPYGAGIAVDPAVGEAARRATADAALEELCVAYVALTRAKSELQVLLPEKADLRKPAFFDHVSRVCGLGGGAAEWTDGDPDWFAERAELQPLARGSSPDAGRASGEAPWPPLLAPLPRAVGRRRTPSREGHGGKSAAALFAAPAGETAAERGTSLHEALARVEWLPAAPGEQPAGIDAADLDLSSPSPLRDALVRPTDAVDLWRERSFEQLAGAEWISGTFDRVVFRGEGEDRRAEIYDWKTNRLRPGETPDAFAARMAETYAGQMRAYRAAVARLANLPADRVSATLLLTETRAAVPARDVSRPASARC